MVDTVLADTVYKSYVVVIENQELLVNMVIAEIKTDIILRMDRYALIIVYVPRLDFSEYLSLCKCGRLTIFNLGFLLITYILWS